MWGQLLVNAAAGLISNALAGPSASSRMYDSAGRISNVRTPTMSELEYTPELLSYLEDLELQKLGTPHTLGPSAFEAISTDPSLRQDQILAINQARQRALQGFTTEDRAALQEYLQAAQAQAQSARKQVLEDAARRGAVDSGASLIAALQGAQDSANMLNQQAMRQAALKLQQQNLANEQLSQLAAGLEQRDYGRAVDLAQRRDAIEQFNKQLLQRRDETNVDLSNQERKANYLRRAQVADTNVDIKNTAKKQNIESRKWISDFDLRKAGAAANAESEANKQYGIERSNRVAGMTDIFNRAIPGIISLFGGSSSSSGGQTSQIGQTGIGQFLMP